MDEAQIEVEREFLSILVLYSEISFDLLQIKPKCLQYKENQRLLEDIIAVYKKDGIVSLANLVDYDSTLSIERTTEIISDERIPVIDKRKNFMSDQVIILNNYKRRAINNLHQKLTKKEMTLQDYLDKMEIINETAIRVGTEALTEEELRENISKSKVLIELKSFKELNKLLQLEQGDFLIIGASTGVGKSGLLLNFMNDLMDKFQCIYFNMEMTKSTVYRRMVSIHSDVPLSYLEKSETDYQKNLIQKAITEIAENKVIVEHKVTSLDEIKSVIKIAKNDKKHTIIFLDHIGLIKSTGSKSQYEQMTDIAKQLRQICLDYDCTIIAACQLNRASYNSEELSISMLKDSGELENSSSKVILLYRDKEDREKNKDSYNAKMYLEIVKNREGPHGRVLYNYDKTKQIFREEIIY